MLTAENQRIIPNSSEDFLLLKYTPIYQVQQTNSDFCLKNWWFVVFLKKVLHNLNQSAEEYMQEMPTVGNQYSKAGFLRAQPSICLLNTSLTRNNLMNSQYLAVQNLHHLTTELQLHEPPFKESRV